MTIEQIISIIKSPKFECTNYEKDNFIAKHKDIDASIEITMAYDGEGDDYLEIVLQKGGATKTYEIYDSDSRNIIEEAILENSLTVFEKEFLYLI